MEDQEDVSNDIKSDAKMTSQNKEENKCQSHQSEHNKLQGLYLNLSTAQAYSIMSSIPKEYRLLEKTYLKKSVGRRRKRAVTNHRNGKNKDNRGTKRGKRQRENKNKDLFINSAYIDEYDLIAPPKKPTEGPSEVSWKGRRKKKESAVEGCDSDSPNSKKQKQIIQGNGSLEDLQKQRTRIHSQRNGIDYLEDQELEHNLDDLPVNGMRIKLKQVAHNEQSPDNIAKIQKNQEHPDLWTQLNNPVPNHIRTANPLFPTISTNGHDHKLKAEEENLSDCNENFSCQAILSAYNK